MSCQEHVCADCGDRLIHQTRRGHNESSSAYGQHIHDDHPNDFFWLDVDGGIYKNATRVLRFVEHKFPGGNLSKGQRTVLPLLARAVESLVVSGDVHPQSGVFVVTAEPPWGESHITRVTASTSSGVAYRVAGTALRQFETGHVVDGDDVERAA